MNMFLVFKNWVATQSAQVILIFKRFGERWRQKGKRENDEAAFYLIQGKKEKMLESIQTYKDYRSRNE